MGSTRKTAVIARQVQVQRLSHADRRLRRERIAADVGRGRSLSAVAQKYAVGIPTVRSACTEFGVDWRRERNSRSHQQQQRNNRQRKET